MKSSRPSRYQLTDFLPTTKKEVELRGWDQLVPGHNVGSRLVVSIPPEYGYGSRGIPSAGIGGGDTLVFVIDIISTTQGR